MGLAFVDTLLTSTPSTITFAIIDKNAAPGGHWNTAYPFVRLHQPSAFYGVNSRPLGNNTIDQVGWNKGLYELATCHEVCDYYSQLMTQRFLPSGRVQYFSNCELNWEKESFRSTVTGKEWKVGQGTKIVDATFLKVTVPSMVPPPYKVKKGVDLVTPNDLARASRPYSTYTIVGAGKTAMDACLWLLAQDVQPSQIVWIMPRDAWLLDREGFQPGPLFAERNARDGRGMVECSLNATSVNDFLSRMEAAGLLLRFDKTIWPTRYKCATVSLAELDQLRRITRIVRMGRVLEIRPDEVVLQKGSYKPDLDSLYVDCTAEGLKSVSAVPVFQGNKITLQSVRVCQQVLSAALIGHVESAYEEDQVKNELCCPVPHPDVPQDYPRILGLMLRNAARWHSAPKTIEWLAEARLHWGMGTQDMLEGQKRGEKLIDKKASQWNALAEKLCKMVETVPEGQERAQL